MEAGGSTVELQEKEDGEILTSSTEGVSTTDLLASPVKSLKSSNSLKDSPLLRTKLTININQQSLNNRLQNTYNNAITTKAIDPNSAISTPNTDNLLDLNFPKFNVLGKEQAKRRLQAFSMFRNNSLLKMPIKKTINKSKSLIQFTEDVYNEDGEKIDEKTIMISKPSRKVTNPEKKAKTVIEEIEEMKKIETAYREAYEEKLLSDFKKRNHKNRKEEIEKEGKKDKLQSESREKSENKFNEKIVKNPPSDWKEFMDNNFDLCSVRALRSKERDYGVTDFRKQLLFESCAVPLNAITVKSISGLDKIVPAECIRFTKCHPSIPFNVNPNILNGKYLSRTEIFNYVPKSHANILNNIITSTVTLGHMEVTQTKLRKWYPKIGLTPVYEAECEVLEPSLGLSFLKSYSGEEEEEEVAIENNFEQVNKENKTNLVSEPIYMEANVKDDQRHKSMEDEKDKIKSKEDKKNDAKKRKNIRKQKKKQEKSDSEEGSNFETESDDPGSTPGKNKNSLSKEDNPNIKKDSRKAKKNKKNFRKEKKKKKKKIEIEKSDSEKNENENEINKSAEQPNSKSTSYYKEDKHTKHVDVEEKSLNLNDNKRNSSEEIYKDSVKTRNVEEQKHLSPKFTRRDEEYRKSYSKSNDKVQTNNKKRSKSNDKSYGEKGSNRKRRDTSPIYRFKENRSRRKSTSSSRKSKSPESKIVSKDNDRNTDHRKEYKNDKKFRSRSRENSQRRVKDEISRENQKKPKVKSIAETEFGTPDTNDYHSNWESDNELISPVKDEQSMVVEKKPTESIWKEIPTREELIFSKKSPSTSSYSNKKIIADEFQLSPRRSRSPKRQKCRKSVTPPFRLDYREFRRQNVHENKSVEMPFFPSISYSLNSKDDTKSFEDSFQDKPRSRKTSPAIEKSPRRIKTSDKSPKRKSQRCLQRDCRSPSRDDLRLEDESSRNVFDISEKYRSFEKSPVRRSTKRYLDYSPKRKKESKFSPVRDFRLIEEDNYKSKPRENRTSVDRNTIFRRSNSVERRLPEVGYRRSVSVEKQSHFRRSVSLERMPEQHRISSTDENFRKKSLNQISPSIDYNISPSSYHKTEHSSYDVLSSFGGPLEMPLNIRHKRRESLEVTWKNDDFFRSNRRVSYKESSYQIFSEDSWERDDYKKIDLEMEERTLEEERLRLIEERRKVAMERRQLEEMEMERRKAEEFEIEREKFEYERRQIENRRRRVTDSIGGTDSPLFSDDDLKINRNYRERKHAFSGLTYSRGKTKHLDVESKKNFSNKKGCFETLKENTSKGKVDEGTEKRSVSRSSEKQKDIIDICSVPLNLSCSSNETFLESSSKSKPELLENEYEKFMQAVSKSEKVSDNDIVYIQKEKSERHKNSEKRIETKRKKRYSTSSSSDSSSSSSGSSSSDSTSSGDTDSESSSSDSEPKKNKSKRLEKHKQSKDISSQAERILEDREFSKVIIKMEPPDDEVVVKSISVLTRKDVDEFNLAPIKSEKVNTPKPVSPVSANEQSNTLKTNFTDIKLLDIPLPGRTLSTSLAAKASVAEIPLPSLPIPVPSPVVAPAQIVSSTVASTSDFSSISPVIKIEKETSSLLQASPSKKVNLIPIKLLSAETRKQANESPLTVSVGTIDVKSSKVSSTTLTEDDKMGDDSLNTDSQGVKRQTRFTGMSIPNKKILLDRSVLFGDEDDEEVVEMSDSSINKTAVGLSEKLDDNLTSSSGLRITSHEEELKVISNDASGCNKAKDREMTDFQIEDTTKILSSPKLEKLVNKSPSKSYDEKSSKVYNKRRDSSRDRVKRRRSTSPYRERRRESPRKRGSSPKRRSPRHKRDSRRRSSISPRRKSPRRDYSPRRRSPSPRRRRDLSPKRREGSPKRRAYSPRRRDLSPRRRTNSPSSLKNKNESIQEALQRIAGINQPSVRIQQSPPIASPIDGSRKSVADSTISDEQLMLQNAGNITESPIYYSKQFQNTCAPMHCDSPVSPRRPSLDERIVKELGSEREDPTKLREENVNYEQIYSYNMEFYDHYSENYHFHYHHDQHIYNSNYQNTQTSTPVNKVVQVGNVLQVVPTEDLSKLQPMLPVPHPKPESSGTQKILQVGNMLQIVPTAVPIPAPVAAPAEVAAEKISPPPPASIPEDNLKKIERQNEKEKRKLEREKKRQEKKVRRLEREKKRQIKLNQKTEDMIKQALLEETDDGVTNEEKTDENELVHQWPPTVVVTNIKSPGKGILISSRMNISGADDEIKVEKKKSVSFADGILPGEGTSPSGGEELCSPPPPANKLPKEKKLKKSKTPRKVMRAKKKVKVKVIRQQNQTEEDDGDEDNQPPPPPPPGSPPPHIFPPRIKTHINNVQPSLMSTLSNSQVLPSSNSYNLYRHPLPVIMPPSVAHHGGPPGSSGLHGPGGLPGPHSVPHVPPLSGSIHPGSSHSQGSHAPMF